jgi:hypothetical protein
MMITKHQTTSHNAGKELLQWAAKWNILPAKAKVCRLHLDWQADDPHLFVIDATIYPHETNDNGNGEAHG